MSSRPLDPAPDDLEPDDIAEIEERPGARLERRGNGVDYRGPDGRLLILGVTEDPDAILALLDGLGVKPPVAFYDWVWTYGG